MLEVLQRIFNALTNLKTGGRTSLIKITGTQVAVTSATYATGRVLGTTSPISIEPVRGVYGTGIIHSVIIQDLSAQSGALDLVFFDSNPTATTCTNNSTLDIADADLPKVIGTVSVAASDYASFNDNVVATVKGVNLPIKSLSSSNLWVVPVSRDAKTYVANELSIVIGILQD